MRTGRFTGVGSGDAWGMMSARDCVVTRGQGTEKGIHTVDCFDPSREVEMEDRLLDPDGILFNLVPILVHEHDDARQCSHEIV